MTRRGGLGKLKEVGLLGLFGQVGQDQPLPMPGTIEMVPIVDSISNRRARNRCFKAENVESMEAGFDQWKQAATTRVVAAVDVAQARAGNRFPLWTWGHLPAGVLAVILFGKNRWGIQINSDIVMLVQEALVRRYQPGGVRTQEFWEQIVIGETP